jgi:hypothetical protein
MENEKWKMKNGKSVCLTASSVCPAARHLLLPTAPSLNAKQKCRDMCVAAFKV